jgi:subtilisin family serine protease
VPNVPQPGPIPGGNPGQGAVPRENPDLGVCRFTPPKAGSLIDASSAGWGEVPSNQVLVEIDSSLSFEEARTVAQQLADALGGQVVGELQYTNLFQIETQSQSLDELIRDISNSRNYQSVALAFPNQQVYRESPLDDSIYRGENGKSYEIIGVRDAWDLIHGAQINLSKVQVGITDDGLYKGYGEFDKTYINTSINLYEGAPPSLLISPLSGFETAGSHGTGVMNILAADPDDGGLVGIASEPLEGKLAIDIVNILYNIEDQEKSFITISLLGLKKEIENGCTILSCSWGNSNADPDATVAYEDWFKKLSIEYPDLLFVCSAGNDRGEMDVTRRIPNGLPNSPDSLPNVLTVGNILNSCEVCPLSNRNSNNKYVALAAPGEQAVWGMDNSGKIYNSGGGTSMATPQVTAAAALIRSINPGLTANEIKDVLTETGRNNIEGKDAPADLGGVILAIDKAIDRVIRERPAEIKTPWDTPKVVNIPIYDNPDVQGSADTTYYEPTGFDATVTIRSTQFRGYDVSVDGNLLGTEGKGQDTLDGIFTFRVAGNQQHLIRADHPQNWKRWQYFYDAGESYTYDF